VANIPPVHPGADQDLIIDANDGNSEDEDSNYAEDNNGMDTRSAHSPNDSDDEGEEEADDGVADKEGLDNATAMGAGPRQSMRENKGRTMRYRDYSLLLNSGDVGEQKEPS
jgi:hypothetical protein